jgi:ABC-2 type transport system ATP-binding protein
MSGLDPLGRNLVKTIMKELNQAWTTIFFNTHILSDVQEIAHRFSIINKWQVIFTWKVADVKGSLEQFFVEKIKSTWEEIQIK